MRFTDILEAIYHINMISLRWAIQPTNRETEAVFPQARGGKSTGPVTGTERCLGLMARAGRLDWAGAPMLQYNSRRSHTSSGPSPERWSSLASVSLYCRSSE